MKQIAFLILLVSFLSPACEKLGESSNKTALVLAVKEGNIDPVKGLLAQGVSPDTRDGDGVPVLMWASEGGYAEIVKLLLDDGADVNAERTKDGTTVLMETAEEGHAGIVKLLLENGAEVNSKRKKDGITALMEAADKCHDEIVGMLLDKGADPDSQMTKDGTTALMESADEGCTEVVKLLLERGAEVNAQRTKDGTTALMEAAEGGRTEIVRLLIDKGADVNMKAVINNFEITALNLAKKERHIDIVEILEKAAAKANAETATQQYDQIALSEITHLTTAQETYYAMEAEFCSSLEELRNAGEADGVDMQISPEVTVIIEQADDDGYVMKTLHKKGKKIYMSRFSFSENIHDQGEPEISEVEEGKVNVLKGFMGRSQ